MNEIMNNKQKAGWLLMTMDVFAGDMFDDRNFNELSWLESAQVFERIINEELINIK